MRQAKSPYVMRTTRYTEHPHKLTWDRIEDTRCRIINNSTSKEYFAMWQLIKSAAEAHGDSALTEAVVHANDGRSGVMTQVLMCDYNFDPRPLLAAMQVLISTF